MRYNCHGCPNLEHQDMMGCPLYSCKESGMVVAQTTDDTHTHFTHTKTDCPLPDDQVAKQDHAQPRKHWTTIPRRTD